MDNLEKKLKEVKQETQESKRDLDKVQLELQQLQTFITVQVDRIPRDTCFFSHLFACVFVPLFSSSLLLVNLPYSICFYSSVLWHR